MSGKSITRWTSVVAIVAMCLAATSVANAQTGYVWAGGGVDANWNDVGFWGDANVGVYPQIAGDTATFNDSAIFTVSLQDMSIGLGRLTIMGGAPIPDPNYPLDPNFNTAAAPSAYTFANGGVNGKFVFGDVSGAARIESNYSNVTFNTAIQLDANLTIYAEGEWTTDGVFINGDISGTGGLIREGGAGSLYRNGGALWLNGNNTFTGGLETRSGTTWGTTATAFGAGTIFVNGGILMSYANDDGNADHSANNVIVAGTGWQEIDLRSGNYLGWGSDSPTGVAVALKYGALTILDGDGILETDGTGYNSLEMAFPDDANFTGIIGNRSSITFNGVTLGTGTHEFYPYDQDIFLGHVTGAGGLALGGWDGRMYLDDNTNDFAGGVKLNSSCLILGSTNPTGPGGVILNGGSLVSLATSDAEGDHSGINLLVLGNNAYRASIYGGQTMPVTGTDVIPNGDANFAVLHKFGDLTFAAGATLTTALSNALDSMQIVGTTTLTGESHINAWSPLTLTGLVQGDNLNLDSGSLFMTNTTNTYTDTTITGGVLEVSAAGQLGTGVVYMNGGTLNAYPSNIGTTDITFLGGGILNSIAGDDANADHSATNITMASSGNIIGFITYTSGGYHYDGSATDANFVQVTHKFGDLTFAGSGLTLTVGAWDTGYAVVEFAGTTTLDNSVFNSYREKIVLSGLVQGGSFSTAGDGAGLWLTGNANTYTDTDVTSRVVVTAAGALGTGTVYLNGGVLYSLAADSATANHSYANVTLLAAGGGTIAGGQVFSASGNLQDADANLKLDGLPVTHTFGDLTFAASGQTFGAGTWPAYQDVIKFVGTTSLVGDSILFPYQNIVLAGQVTGDNLVVSSGYTAGRGVSLTGTASSYADTLINGNRLAVTSAGALGTGTVYLNGGTLYAAAATADDANFASINTVVLSTAYTPRGTGSISAARAINSAGNVVGANVDANFPATMDFYFGDLSFADVGMTFNSGGNYTYDRLHFVGTITLNGTTNFYAGIPLYLDGKVTGDGTLTLPDQWAGGGGRVFLTGNDNDYGDTELLGSNGHQLVITAPHALGTGTVYMTGASLASLADNDANANHSYANITLLTGNSAIGGYTSTFATTALGVHHKFGGLTFSTSGQQLTAGGSNGTWIEFTGTTTLMGESRVRSYRNGLIFSGQITGTEDDSLYVMSTDGAGGVWLTNNANDHNVTTLGASAYVFATAPHALGNALWMNAGSTLYSVALDDANANHSYLPVTMLGSGNIHGIRSYNARPFDGTSDPNFTRIVTHKFGDLTFSDTGQQLGSGGYQISSDIIEFTGTTTLVGTNKFRAYGERIYLTGQVTGESLAVADTNNYQGLWLFNSSNDFADASTTASSSYLYAVGAGVLGTGTLYLQGGRFYQLADNDANADYSTKAVVLLANSTIYGYDANTTTPGGNVYNVSRGYGTTHKFGDLEFATTGLTLTTAGGTYTADANIIDKIAFEGTITLTGTSTFAPGTHTFLNGKVTGDGTLVTTGTGTYQDLILTNDTNDYGGGTDIRGLLTIMSPNPLGTGAVYLNGGRLDSVATSDAQADHSSVNLTVLANSYLFGDQSYNFFYNSKDPNVGDLIHHKYGDVLFATGGLTLTTNNWPGGHQPGNDEIWFEGTMTLNGNTTIATNYSGAVQIDGLIVDTLDTPSTLIKASPVGSGTVLRITGSNNLYSGGTVIGRSGSILTATGTDSLGTGDVTIGDRGSILNLDGVNTMSGGTQTIIADGYLRLGDGASSVVGDVIPGVTNPDGNIYIYNRTTQLLDNTGSNVSSLSVHSIVQNAVSVGNNATLIIRGDPGVARTTNVVNTLTIAGGTVDIKANYLIVQNGSIATVEAQLGTGINGGAWDGKGINSSKAAQDLIDTGNYLTGVGSISNNFGGSPLYGSGGALAPTFGDEANVALDAVLVRYTFYGDADLNGVVDLNTDYYQWLAGYANSEGGTPDPTQVGWLYGDFDHNGTVDLNTDYYLWLAGYAASEAATPLPLGPSSVPEPATLVLLGLGAVSLLTRRKNRI